MTLLIVDKMIFAVHLYAISPALGSYSKHVSLSTLGRVRCFNRVWSALGRTVSTMAEVCRAVLLPED